jgi:hypothetical protein
VAIVGVLCCGGHASDSDWRLRKNLEERCVILFRHLFANGERV